MKNVVRNLSWTGVVFIGLSLVLYAVLEFLFNWKQTKASGGKDILASGLGLIFGIPILFSAAAGLLCLLVGGLALVYRRSKAQAIREHREAIQQRRSELRRQLAEQEQKARIIGRVRFP